MTRGPARGGARVQKGTFHDVEQAQAVVTWVRRVVQQVAVGSWHEARYLRASHENSE